ncbi:MAG: biotin carboxylase N-terminal domain-containing protein [Xanthobacteraceae bacterium]
MFASVLIANRGEIACRIARTAKRLGMRTIAVYSAADARAPHVRACDEAHLLGPAPARESYLSIQRLIEVATKTGAACIHPGYGFLSENADFVDACTQAGIVFVGPPAAAMRAMGLKDRAKALMEKAGVPVVPGYYGARQDKKFLKEKAYEIGYPVLIKPAAGGGGRGLRRVDRHADFEAALESATREAEAAFGVSRVLLEKCVAAPRHVEIQVFADRAGDAIHLGERDCSLQRRHQKVIEESPAPGMTAELRARIGGAAVEAAKAVGYCGAGTVEFIADGTAGLRADAFWFIEMNTRLQVEHAVTEAVTGLDLVEWQFRVAAGEKLPLTQRQVRFDGHAIEARLYAEDPANDFLPSTGTVLALQLPAQVRVDSGIEAGGEVTPYYDPMIAKLIAHAPSRQAALDQLTQALEDTLIAGPRSNLVLLAALCRSPEFRQGRIDTEFIDRSLAALGALTQPTDYAAAALGVARLLAASSPAEAEIADADRSSPDDSPWAARDGFQLAGPRVLAVPIIVDGANAEANVTYGAEGPRVSIEGAVPTTGAQAWATGQEVFVLRAGRQTRVRLADFGVATMQAPSGAAASGAVRAPMHGRVLDLFVGVGDHIVTGQRLAVIEAMKMEHTLKAAFPGIVRRMAVTAGQQVVEGGEIMVIEPAATG